MPIAGKKRFARRVLGLEDEGAYQVLAHAQALEKSGRHIIHLEIGQPDQPTFPHISQRGMNAIAEGQTRYNPSAGIPALRQAIAEQAGEQRGVQFSPQQVVVGPGAKPGLFFTTLALVEPGDEVIYPDPGFPTYPAMIAVAGGIPVPAPVLESNNFSLDLDTLEALVNRRTRVIIINSPANPTGGVIPRADLEHIAALAQNYGCWVISDEIYSRLSYDNRPVPSIASLPDMLERTIIVDGFSKTYAMTGWRLGYAIMPEKLAERVTLLLTHSVGCTATFTQVAGLHALQASQEMVTAMQKQYQHRRDKLIQGLNALPGVSCQIPQGAFYAFPNVKSFGISSREIGRRLLEEAGVAVLPGSDFGKWGEGYLRLCYAASLDDLDLALERMGEFFGGLLHKCNALR